MLEKGVHWCLGSILALDGVCSVPLSLVSAVAECSLAVGQK